jgi:hypothetical protein
MGHVRLGDLPRTRKWNQVVDLLDSDAPTARVAAATLEASKRGLEDAAKDPALIYTFWLLTQLPLCAKKSDYDESLRRLGVLVADKPGLFDLVGAFSDSIDEYVRRTGGRTDLGELAQMGGAESLAATLRRQADSLFGTTPADVQRELANMATTKNFSFLARDFFSRLSEKYLAYFLSRQLSNQYRNVDQNRQFREALSLHCKQASKIVEQFAGGWYSKTNYEGGITPRKAANFVHVALKKIRAELEKGAEGGGL